MIQEVRNLREQEIVEFLREDLNFEIHDNKALHRPDSTFVVEVLSTCATKCLSKKKEDLASIDFQGLSKIHHESHTDGIQFFNHFYCIKELMDMLNIQDFSLVDIIEPQSKRIKYLLSVIIGYIQLKDREEGYFRENIMRNKELEDKVQFKKMQYEKDKAEHEALLAKKHKEMPLIREHKQEIEFLQQEIKLKNDFLAETQAEEDVIKKETQGLDRQIHELKDKINMIRLEKEQLEKKIVRSPEKIIDGLTEITDQVKNEKETMVFLDEDINKLSLQLEIYSSLQQNLEEPFKMMEDMKNTLSNERNTRKKLKDRQKDLAQLKDQIDQKQKTLEDAIKAIKTNEERTETIESQVQKRIEQINSMIGQLQKEKLNLQKDIDEAISSVKTTERLNADIDNQIKEKASYNDQMIREVSDIYDDLLLTLQSLHSDLSYLFEGCKQKPGQA